MIVKNMTKGMFLHSVDHSQEGDSESRAEQKRKVAEIDQQIRSCRDRRKLGQVCSVPADARDSPAFL